MTRQGYRSTSPETRKPPVIEQRPIAAWPDGLEHEALMLRVEPDELAARTGISFERDHDDLDYFDGAIVTIDGGVSVAFQQYANAPTKGTVVIVPDFSPGTFAAVVRLLSLTPAQVAWMADRAKSGLQSAMRRAKFRAAWQPTFDNSETKAKAGSGETPTRSVA